MYATRLALRMITDTENNMSLSAKRFPTLYHACLKVASERHERFTPDLFDQAVRRYPADSMKVVENKLWAMTPEKRLELVRTLGF